MPSASTEPSFSVTTNSASSSSDGPARKSHDRTIGGIFTYTDGKVTEPGLADHKLEHIKSWKSGSNTSLPNGMANGVAKVGKEAAQTKPRAGSTHSVGSRSLRSFEVGRTSGSQDGHSKLWNVENASELPSNGHIQEPVQDTETVRSRSTTHQSTQGRPESYYAAAVDGPHSPTHPSHSSVSKNILPQGHRFSSPPRMSEGMHHQDATSDSFAQEGPRRPHRHTLQVPKLAGGSTARSSRDFSFGGPSEEALSASGRFSPTRDTFDGQTPHRRRASLGLVRRLTKPDTHVDDVPQDEDAARWTEVIKQKRASRRKRREEEDDDRVIVGKKVEEGHVNWVTAYNMLTGIRFTVSRTNAKIDRELTDADFDAKHKFSFDVTGNELTPSAKYDFKFKDYAPWVFRHLRAIFGLDPADYLMSLTSKYILSELGSPGKSGSFFYFSRDYKYIIKTIHPGEHKILRKILRDYYRHMRDNPNSLISQLYGLHRVKIPYGKKVHFVVMNNLFPPHRDIHFMFDLKGSTVGRDFKEDALSLNPRITLKDLNWLRRDLHLEFDDRLKSIFIEQVKKDVGLFQRLHIMDYSLLVGIHDMEKGNEEKLRETTLKVFQPGGERDDDDTLLTRTPSRMENARKARQLRLTLKKERPVPMGLVQAKMPNEMEWEDERKERIFYKDDGGIRAVHDDGRAGEQVYYLGIIDCLTHYGLVKRLEHFWKGLSAPSSQISPIPPVAYGDRFIDFITGITMTHEEAERRRTTEGERIGPEGEHILVRPYQQQTPASRADDIYTRDGSSSIPTSPVERTMWKAQKQVDRETSSEKGRRRSEEEIPDRTLRTEERSSALLPVVDEGAESGNSSTLEKDPVPEPTGDYEQETPIASFPSFPNPGIPQQPQHTSSQPFRANGNGIRAVSSSTATTTSDPPPSTPPDVVKTSGSRPQDLERDAGDQDEDEGYGTQPPYDSCENETTARSRQGLPPRLDSSLIPKSEPLTPGFGSFESPRVEPLKR